MIKRTDNELGKSRQNTNYLETQKEQGCHEQRTFIIIPYSNMELCRNIMVELNSLFHSRGGVDFNGQ
jgi:hypothetical protein